MQPGQIIVLATPVFLLLIALEFVVGLVRERRGTGRNTYRLNDAVNSISLGMLSQISAVLTKLLRIGIYTAIFEQVALFPDTTFWTTWYGWLLALVFYDFCYYWLHRMGHESAVLWAAHVVHHQSQDYNLSTALRQTSSGALLGWIFYVPMAVAGVPPLVFAVVALVDLLYQFWVHTEQVGKLGWFDRWFCSPSNHRVHHAVNDRYLDRNYGGILILWDRLFGTFQEENERCVYGTRSPLNSWDPLWANAEVYWALAQDSWHARRWGDKLRVWLKPPGWRPADVAARCPMPPFDLQAVRTYHPPVPRAVLWWGAVQFVALLVGVSVFLWFADTLPLAQSAIWLAALTAGLWAVGGMLQGRFSVLETLMVHAAALATATSALGLLQWHMVFKPLVMVFALVFVATCRGKSSASGQFHASFHSLLMAALFASLAGDVFLMLQGFFIPGLVSFLIAHLCYLALFQRGVGWFPGSRLQWLPLLVGMGMYAFLWVGGLPPALRLPVAAYVLVIALMAAQALGHAMVLRTPEAIGVAAGASVFMLSDATLATNRFVAPLPHAQFWVLATYYAAQFLIVRHSVRSAQASGVE